MLDLILKKEELNYERINAIVILAMEEILGDEGIDNSAVAYIGVLSNIVLMKNKNYDGVDNFCESMSSEINKNEGLKKVVALYFTLCSLLKTDFDKIEVKSIVRSDGKNVSVRML